MSTGAGFSGSSAPGAGSSIHRETLPSEYVWSTLNTMVSTCGSGPIDTGNSWNSPGLTPPLGAAVKVSFDTASVSWLPCTSIGGSTLRFSTATVQPGTGMVETEPTGALSGRFTSTLTVDAVSLSFGTRNANRP